MFLGWWKLSIFPLWAWKQQNRYIINEAGAVEQTYQMLTYIFYYLVGSLLLKNKLKNFEKDEEVATFLIILIIGLLHLFLSVVIPCPASRKYKVFMKVFVIYIILYLLTGKVKSRRLWLHLRHASPDLCMQPIKCCSLLKFCHCFLIWTGINLLYWINIMLSCFLIFMVLYLGAIYSFFYLYAQKLKM